MGNDYKKKLKELKEQLDKQHYTSGEKIEIIKNFKKGYELDNFGTVKKDNKDKIESLAEVLREHHSFKLLYKEIKKSLLDLGIIHKHAKIKTKYLNKNKPDCAFACSIKDKDNKFNEKITILIKPDHSKNRCLRIVIQLGRDSIYVKSENKDHSGWKTKKVFKKESEAIVGDMVDFFEKELRNRKLI
jgi:hypothetical protein